MATEIIEYRHNQSGPWIKSYMNWTYEDLMSMNKLFGWDKYRVRYVAS